MSDSKSSRHTNGLEVAIVGMACRFPGARDIDQFWRNLQNGLEAIDFFTESELEASGIDPAVLKQPNYVNAGGFLEDIEMFDAALFGYSPREAEIIDPQHRIFLECAYQALESAGCNPRTYGGSIGVYGGVGINVYSRYIYANRELASSVAGLQTGISNDKDHLTTRVSYKLGLRGPSVAVQTACSTSLVAVQLAHQALLCGACDMALAGGVSIRIPQKSGYFCQEGGIMSPDGHCRAFDAKAEGTVGGNGIGIVVLKRLEEALADGDYIYAVIKGSTINNDGSSKVGYTAPSVEGQARVIKAAQRIAEIDPETITYVETHGSGTPLGDPVEIRALTEAFRARTAKKSFCAIGSVKTNVGHLDTASGVASLIKTALALEHKMIPPSLHFERPNPNIDFANSPFYVNATLAEWKNGSAPRRAGVSSFGLGGTNAHVILEEAPVNGPSDPSRPWQILLLSAKTDAALDRMTDHLLQHLRRHPNLNLADVCFTLQVGRIVYDRRRIVVCRDFEEAVASLESRDPAGVWTAIQSAAHRPIAFMFSGLGDHYVDMTLGLYECEPGFRQQVDYCCEFLKSYLGTDLRDVLYPGREHACRGHQSSNGNTGRPRIDLRKMLDADGQQEDESARKLNQTNITQPALFVIEYALARLWMQWGIRPQALIGYSIGEYVAACLAGVFSLDDALRLVAIRAQLIQKLDHGAMLAVPLSAQELQPLISDKLSISAINGPSLCVLSGPTDEIERFQQSLAQTGLACRRLQATHAFHSNMMRPILASFVDEVAALKLMPPTIPYISNVTGTWITSEQATDPQYWGRHLCEAVRFADGVKELWDSPDRILLEVGPGQTLCSLAMLHPSFAEAEGHLTLSSIRNSYDRQPDMASLITTLGKLWLSGVQVDWSGFYANERRRRLPLPTYPFERQRYWVERPQKPEPVCASSPQAPLFVPSPESQPGPIQTQRQDDAAKIQALGLYKKENLADWFHVPVWKQTPSPLSYDPAGKAIPRSRWLVFIDSCGLGPRIVERLEREEQDVVTVIQGETFRRINDRQYAINPARRDDYDAMFNELSSLERTPGKIVHLWNVTSNEAAAGVELFEKSQTLGFYSPLFLAQALGEQIPAFTGEAEDGSSSIEIAIMSNNMQMVVGDESLRPEKAVILGPCLVIPLEYQNIACRSIDITLPESTTQQEEMIDHLIAELTTESVDPVIAYRRQRWVQQFEPVRLTEQSSSPPRLRDEGVYLITGGLGGLGLALAEYLAKTVRARLILIGRSPFPDGDQWEDYLASHDVHDEVSRSIRKLQALQELGAEVLVVSADVADEQQMRAATRQACERFGQIHGVIHSAGVPPRNMIQRKTPDMAARVLIPKVLGTLVLESIFKDANLDFLVLCSSLRSIMGGHGTVDYTAANAFLDAYARSHNLKDGTLAVSIMWDAWAEVGMAVKGSGRILPKEGLGAGIASSEGIDAFSRILRSSFPEVVVSMHELPALIECNKAFARLRTLSHLFRPAHPRPQLATAYAPPRDETEQALAEIWQELLGIDKVGVQDNFFELGGDSVISLRVISRCNQAGLRLTPKQAFQYQTIAELAAVANTAEVIHTEQGLVAGVLPLTPIQHFFFEEDILSPHHWNQSVFLEVKQTLDPVTLEAVLQKLLEHHDTLRHRFIRNESGWQQVADGNVDVVPLTKIDLSEVPDAKQGAAIEASAAELQASLNLSEGPLVRVGLFDLGETRSNHLLIIVHHLLIDVISWRTLLEDLQTAYYQLSRGEEIQLPRKTTSFKQWAEKLTEYAQSEAAQSELSYWLAEYQSKVFPLPLDYPEGCNTVASAQTVSVSLTVDETRTLMQEVTRIYGVQADDLLLTALVQAFARWTGESYLLINLEGHGRDPIFEDVDLSRTVGWFTTAFPVLFELRNSRTPAEALISISNQLRSVPNGGFNYGLLRHLNGDKAILDRLARQPRPQVSFVYLSQTSQKQSSASVFAPARESSGPKRDPKAARQHVIEITGNISEGQLRANLTYSENIHRRSTIEDLSQRFLDVLCSLISQRQTNEEGGEMSWDLSLAHLTQDEMERALEGVEFEER